MRGMIAGALAGVLLAGAAPAQTITMDGMARSVSLMAQFRAQCGPFFHLDQDYANRMELAFRMAGAKSFGEAPFAKAVQRELPRRAQEVSAAGARQWCADQKAALLKLNAGDLFK